jgi:hypothetical protein
MTTTTTSRPQFYSVSQTVNGQSEYVRTFTRVVNARKLAKMLAKSSWCEEAVVWRGQPGGERVETFRQGDPIAEGLKAVADGFDAINRRIAEIAAS